MAKKKNDQVNVDFSKSLELLEDLDQMVKDDGSDRSKLIRKLVREEKARRQQLPSPAKNPARRKTDSRTAQAVAA